MDRDAISQDPRQGEPVARQAAPTVEAQTGSIDCLTCGLVMPAGSRYCLDCGAQLDAPPGPQPGVAPPPAAWPPAAGAVPQPSPAVAPQPAPVVPPPQHPAAPGGVEPRTFAFGPDRPGLAELIRTPWGVAAAVVLAVVLLVAVTRGDGGGGGGTAPEEPETFHLTGTLSAPSCDGGYDIENANVLVRNQSEELIGSTVTSGDQSVDYYGCEVAFAVDVPRASFYTVRVGTHDGPAYSFDELAGKGWVLSLSLS